MYRFFVVVILLCLKFNTYAQLGGSQSFAFVNIDPTGRTAALGASTMADFKNDLGVGYHNPSGLNKTMDNRAMLSYNNYLTDINSGFGGFVKHFDSFGTVSGSITYTDYGHFDETDETGKIVGQFWAQDYVFQFGYGNIWERDTHFTYGANVKFLYSVYERYIATAFAVDLAGAYHRPESKFHASLLIRNLGYNTIPYVTELVDLPFDIQLGISKKLQHNPLKMTIVGHNLQRFDISYVNVNSRNKNIDLETGQVRNETVPFGDKVMRHFNFGAELVFTDNFQLRGGYNHMRRKELAPETAKGAAGFSWGLGIGIKKFTLDYAMVTYFPGVNVSYFTVSKNISDFKKAKPENY